MQVKQDKQVMQNIHIQVMKVMQVMLDIQIMKVMQVMQDIQVMKVSTASTGHVSSDWGGGNKGFFQTPKWSHAAQSKPSEVAQFIGAPEGLVYKTPSSGGKTHSSWDCGNHCVWCRNYRILKYF